MFSIGVAHSSTEKQTGDNIVVEDENRNRLWGAVKSALYGTDVAVRVNYQSHCELNKGFLPEPIPFPKVPVFEPPASSSEIDRLRLMFSDAEDVEVAVKPSGVIETTVGDVSRELLETKINRLDFTEDAQYNAPTALYEIQETPDFFMKKEALGLRRGGAWEMSTLLAVADDMLPSLPATLDDVTVDEALDLVATTFDFITIFGICEHHYEIAREWREYNHRHDDTKETWEW